MLKKILALKYSWLIILVTLVAINLLASVYHSRIDLTKEKRYTLSGSTNRLLTELEEDMQIDVFLKGDFPSGFRKLANSTEEFVELLKDVNGSRIHYRFISPQDEMPGTGKRYQDTLAGLGASPINLTVQVKAGQEQKFVFPVAVITYKGQTRLINLYTGGNRYISQVEINNAEALLEYQFLKSMDELVYPGKPAVAYAVGNGEPVGPETYDLVQSIRQRYNFYTFNLRAQKFIPDDISVLVIAKPSIQFSEEDKLKIDQYIMRGGNVLLFVDRLFAEIDSFRASGKSEIVAYDRNLNLTDLLFRYGVRINPDLLMDLQCDFMLFDVSTDPNRPQPEFLPWNYFPVFQSKDNHLINRNIGLVAGRFVNSIDTVEAIGVKKTILLSSSSNSRIITTPALISLNENKILPEDAQFKANNIPAAVLLEGNFTSLYQNRAGRAITDSLSAYGVPFLGESGNTGKIIVAGDGDLVLNDMDREEGPLPMGWNRSAYEEYKNGTDKARYFIPFANNSFFTNCLEYFTNKPGIVETGNKEIVLRLLDSTRVKEQKKTWQFINIGLPVLLIILAGFVYQAIRRHRFAA